MTYYTITQYGPDNEEQSDLIKGLKHMHAYSKGLMTTNHPLFEQTQEAVLAQDALDGLYDYEEKLAEERCEETGANVDNQQKIDDLDPLFQKAIKRLMRANKALVDAIDNQ